MTRTGRNLKSVAILLTLFLAVAERIAVAQQSGSKGATADKLLDSKVPEFELQNQTLLDGLWKIARGPAPFSFGFEKVLKRSLADSDVPDTSFSLHMKDKTVREILDALCQADARFTWSMDGPTVNVFPRAIRGDPSYLLNRKLHRFELKDATDVQNGLLAIAHQLPPPVEQIAEAQVGGGDPYPAAPWTVTYHDLLVRQVINRLALHGGPCGIWIFGGAADFRAFGFFNTYLHCPGYLPTEPKALPAGPSKSP